MRIEAAVEADRQQRLGLADDGEAALDTLDRQVDRLLAEDRLLSARRALNGAARRSKPS